MSRRYLLRGLDVSIAILFLCLFATAVCVNRAGAQGLLFPDGARIGRPVQPPSYQPFYVREMHVTTAIHDAVAETTVEQTFVNTSSVEQEATYLYPLPEGATPTAFSMTVGDRTMEPRVLPRDEARGIYEEIVRRRRDPALLEYVGHSLVRVSIFPIPPQGERKIRMRYTQILKPENGMHKYAYPLSTSRFGARPVGTSTVTIKLTTAAPIKNLYSPSHDLSVRKTDEHTATASYEGSNEISDRDLTLYFSTNSDDVGLSLLTYKSGDRDGYFVLLAAPRVSIPKEKILPKQVVFVLDRTGSMAGPKIQQARKSLLYCLNSLHKEDRFDVITFNESPDVLLPKLQPATEENVDRARKFVENIEASGGTNIDEALHAALKLVQADPGTQKMVVFLTDGLPTVGETNINTILQHVRDLNPTSHEATPHARIFCFGLGYDVNVPFLDRLAEQEQADSDFIKPEEDVEARVSAFFAKVASPILSQVKLAFDGADVYDVYPKQLPDLFKGSQLVITGRFRGAKAASVHLTGLASGNAETFKTAAPFDTADGANGFVPRLWAQRKIGYLIDQLRLSNNPSAAANKEVIDEIVRLSREFGIVTEYTSFLVDENEQRALHFGGASAKGDLGADSGRLREEVAKRAAQFGVSGAGVTDQSGRAKDLKNANQNVSRYQSANGSVAQGYAGPGGFGGGGAGGTIGTGLGGRGGLPASGGQSALAAKPASGNFGAARKLGAGAFAGGKGADNTVLVQAVNDRTFYRQANNVWEDHSYDPKQNALTKVQAFSDAHFALLRAYPFLAACSSVGDEVIVRMGKNALQIGKEGKTTLTAAEVKQLGGK